MPAERYYFPHPLHSGDVIHLADTEFHHLTHVMRAEVGDALELVNGEGSLATGRITGLEKKKALITLTDCTQTQRSAHRVILAQALPRMNRLDFIIEKGTELGMDALWLFPGERSERKELSEHQLDRCKGIAIAAMKQSGRLYLPDITAKPHLAKWGLPAGSLFFGDLSCEALPFKLLWSEKPPAESIFFIGPESGFSDREEATLRGWQARGVQLHQNILRTDTAALAAMTLASHWQL